MNKRKILKDLDASLEQLEIHIEQFYLGKSSMYRSVATQLRVLVSKHDSIIKKIFKISAFHPIKGSTINSELRKNLVFQSPATIQFINGKPKILNLFDEKVKPIPLTEWLNQPLLSNKITIGELISSVADKESVHSDDEYNETLSFVNQTKLGVDDLHPHYIVAIGEYVLKSLKHIRKELKPEFDNWQK